MHRCNLLTTVMICLLFSVPGLSLAASSPMPNALPEQNVEAAVEGTIKKIGVLEATRGKPKPSDSSESVDCFYEANKYDADCRNTQVGTQR